MPGEPCAFSGTGPDGYHVARFAWAEQNGLITAADFDVAVVTVGAFDIRTVIYDTEGKGRMPKPLGPFETEREARAAARAAIPPADGLSILSAAQNRQLLGRACEAAGITMGRYDDRIVEWLAGWEDSTVAAIAGWVQRANLPELVVAEPVLTDDTMIRLTAVEAATIAKALADAEAYRREQGGQLCTDCSGHPAGLCEDHAGDLDAADEYQDLAAELSDVVPLPGEAPPDGAPACTCDNPDCPDPVHTSPREVDDEADEDVTR
jgi:hypothetical protein